MPHTWGPRAGHQFTPNSTAPVPAAAAPAPTKAPPVPAAKRRVLFVCIGNSCRSQMAEAFARHYGKDVFEVASAGLAPAGLVAPLTRKAMLEAKGIDLSSHWPKAITELPGPFDLIINISGHPLPPGLKAAEVRTWQVADPVTGNEAVHLETANRIETLVQKLILEARQR